MVHFAMTKCGTLVVGCFRRAAAAVAAVARGVTTRAQLLVQGCHYQY